MGRSAALPIHDAVASFGLMLGTHGQIGGTMVGLVVWEMPINTHQKIERQTMLGLTWPKLNIDNTTTNWQ
jgi:hypothetical protein